MKAAHYQPFWCEENIWQLAADPVVGDGERHVLLITGAAGHVACWNQRAARISGGVIHWDYHVVLAVEQAGAWQIWDLDTVLGYPLPAMTWINGTFPYPERVPAGLQPRLLLVPAQDWRRDLWSDRSHMRTATGGWSRPPPPWPMPQGSGATLADYLDQARSGMDLETLRRRFL